MSTKTKADDYLANLDMTGYVMPTNKEEFEKMYPGKSWEDFLAMLGDDETEVADVEGE